MDGTLITQIFADCKNGFNNYSMPRGWCLHQTHWRKQICLYAYASASGGDTSHGAIFLNLQYSVPVASVSTRQLAKAKIEH